MTTISIFAGELVYCSSRSYQADGIPLSFLIDNCPSFGWAYIDGENVVLDNKHFIPLNGVIANYENYRREEGMGLDSWN